MYVCVCVCVCVCACLLSCMYECVYLPACLCQCMLCAFMCVFTGGGGRVLYYFFICTKCPQLCCHCWWIVHCFSEHMYNNIYSYTTNRIYKICFNEVCNQGNAIPSATFVFADKARSAFLQDIWRLDQAQDSAGVVKWSGSVRVPGPLSAHGLWHDDICCQLDGCTGDEDGYPASRASHPPAAKCAWAGQADRVPEHLMWPSRHSTKIWCVHWAITIFCWRWWLGPQWPGIISD